MYKLPTRSDLIEGLVVEIESKKDQSTGKLTTGMIKEILTTSASHPHGIKVKLEGGQVGRVKKISNTPHHDKTERYMAHLHNTRYSRHDAASILRRARDLTGDDITVRDVRVSKMHIEMDITIPHGALNDTMMAVIPIGHMLDAHRIIEETVYKQDAIKNGIAYFNAERFWECHEAFEGVWKECFEGEKDLVQGIILAAAGLVHYQKSQDEICLSIFNRALQKLSSCTGIYHTIDVERLKTKLHNMVQNKEISTFELA